MILVDPPVDPVFALHVAIVDQGAAQLGTVRMVTLNDLVDLPFGIAALSVEMIDQPGEDDMPLIKGSGNLL